MLSVHVCIHVVHEQSCVACVRAYIYSRGVHVYSCGARVIIWCMCIDVVDLYSYCACVLMWCIFIDLVPRAVLYCRCRHHSQQHTATHYITLQHTVTYCNTLQHTASHCSTLQHTVAHCNALQHTGHYFQ